MFRRILVPLDGSLLAEAALAPAFGLAQKFGGDMVLLRAVPPARTSRRLSLSAADVEAFLARLYTDEDFLARFLDAPGEVLERESFSGEERVALAAIDRSELILAANSYRHKRDTRKPR